ncbi:hypothetical protein [Actinomadura sp. 21ATH]|uniref:hypothetical protein n=1 Tax=Actinomadura sp. 21ATH TaxID=1735444 RepID=UPI0035BF52FD
MDVVPILAALESHAMASGRFERVNLHEAKSAPGPGLTAALWVQKIRPWAAASGLDATSGVVTFMLRIYQNMLAEPQDAIDPTILSAIDHLAGAYSNDFTLDGLIRNVDLLGASGESLSAQAGYISIDRQLMRVMDLTIPCIVNDLWEQAP